MEIRSNGKIVEVEYAPEEQVTVELQHQVKAALKKVAAQHPVGMLVHVPRSLRNLDVSVGAFWMGAMRELAPGLKAMAAVTNSRPLATLANRFSQTLELVGTKVQIRVFESVGEAKEWLEQVV